MTTELKQAAQDAAEAIDWLLNTIRRDAPQLSGKAMGNAEKCACALRAALAQQPATSEPVAWMASYVDPVGNDHVYVTSHRDLAVENDMHGEPKPLYTHAAPSLPDAITPPTEDGTEYDYASWYTAGYAEGWNDYRDGIAWLLEAN